MKKIFVLGFLLISIFLSFCTSEIVLDVDTNPPVNFQFNGTYTMTAYTDLGSPVSFNVTHPVKVTVSSQIEGAPSKTTFGVILSATANGCPPGQIKYDGNCYPSDAVFDTFEITQQILKENGNAWKVEPIIYRGPGGKSAVNGKITVSFSRISEPVDPVG